MLMLHNGTSSYPQPVSDLTAPALPPGVRWVDLLDASAEEIAYVERAVGRHLPALTELKEIESSSRLHFGSGTFCLSTPLVARSSSGMRHATPVGIILTKDLLITIRFAALTAFTSFAQDFAAQDIYHEGGVGAYVGLVDAIVDRAADVLENVGGELDQISQAVFSGDAGGPDRARRPARETAGLRETLRRIGFNGDLASKIRDSLLGLSRMVSYVAGMGGEWFTPELRAQLETQQRDIASLSDYDAHLTGKVQLLLDATMGLINIEQNNIIKVLTIVSVVGVPPTLVASIYGMNFHDMPELGWRYGYLYGLAVIGVSAIAPLIWFKIRGWL